MTYLGKLTPALLQLLVEREAGDPPRVSLRLGLADCGLRVAGDGTVCGKIWKQTGIKDEDFDNLPSSIFFRSLSVSDKIVNYTSRRLRFEPRVYYIAAWACG